VDGEAGNQQRAAVVATLSAAVMIAGFVGGKATRDALFLDAFSAAELPKAMLASALLSAIGVALMSRGMTRYGPARLVPLLYAVNGGIFFGEYGLAERAPRPAAALIYIHVAVLGTLLISGFWSVVSERFDPHTAKRVVSRITAGATSGGLIGGLVAERVAAWLDARAMLLVLGIMSLVCAGGVYGTGRGSRHEDAEDSGGILTGLGYLQEAPYLKMLALLVALGALTSGLLDYAFKAEAAAAYGSREELMTFFAIFYTATGLVTFLGQTFLSRPALDKLGLGGTIALLPASVMVGSVLGAAVTRLWTVVLVRGVGNVLENSLYTSGYQLLFTPLTPDKKRPTKTVIDVGFDRLGGAIGSGLVMAVLALQASWATVASLVGAAVASLVALAVAFRLHRGYVAELARSLESGRVKLADSDVIDATTRRTLADTTMAIDRNKLLAEIEQLREDGGAIAGDPSAAAGPTLPSEIDDERPTVRGPTSLEEHPLYQPLADLLSHDPVRVRRALRPPLDRRIIAFAIPLLGDNTHARAARRVLKEAAPRALGQLVDAMLDEDLSSRVRRRLPEIVASARSRRAAVGLFAAIGANENEVRERAARALSDLIETDPLYAPDRREVFNVVMKELARQDVWLPRVFMFLELTLERDPLRLALSALRSDDTNLRGTAYEYLENVLPDEMRDALWPLMHEYAGAEAPVPASRRSQRQLRDLLEKSAEALVLDRADLSLPPSDYPSGDDGGDGHSGDGASDDGSAERRG